MPLKIDNESELREAQAALFNVNSSSGWLVLSYVSSDTVHFAAGGEGSVDELSGQLEDGQVQYALIRINVDGSPRDVFINWTGPGANTDEKSGFLGDAEALLQPFHASVTVLSKNNFNEDSVREKSSSGSSVID